MKFAGFFCALMCACVAPVFALTAKVVASDGSPISAVTMLLAHEGASAISDDSGIVTLNGIAIIPLAAQSGTHLCIQNSTVQLSLPQATQVHISIVTLTGRSIFQKNQSLAAGTHALPLPELSNGLYILKAKIGSASFTGKINTANTYVWSGDAGVASLGARLASVAAVQSVIDTAVFSKDGYVTVRKPITSYAENVGTVVLAPAHNIGDWFGFERMTIDTAMPNFVNILFRAYDQNGYGRTDFDVRRITCLEDNDSLTVESKFTVEKAITFNYTVRTVLLLDNSLSVKDSITKIRDAAKTLVRAIGPNQQIAIYAFSSNATLLQDFTSDTTALLAAVDNVSPGPSSTNFYGSLITGLSRIADTADMRNFRLVIGNVVIFTDGTETANTSTLSQALAAKGNKRVYSVGLGSEIDLSVLRQISGIQTFATSNASDISGIFTTIQSDIAASCGSYWWAHYRTPLRNSSTHTINMSCTGNTNMTSTATFSGQFSSNGFVDVWAPTADSLKVVMNATGDTLVGSYVYNSRDSMAEGSSVAGWYVNGSSTALVSGLRLAKSLIPAYATQLQFRVQPVALYGIPNVGVWSSTTIGFLNIATVSNGTVSASPAKGVYATGDSVTLTATPAAGYGLKSWGYSGISGRAAVIKIPVAGVVTVTPVFDILYTVTVNGGSGSGSFMEGSVDTLIAVDSMVTKYGFARWVGADTALLINKTATTTTFTMPARNVSFDAAYLVPHTVTFAANGGTGAMNIQTITGGASANLAANSFVNTGFMFTGWATSSTGAVVYADMASFVMGGTDVSLYAVWKDATVAFDTLVLLPAPVFEKAFWIQNTECTQGEYKRVMNGVNPSYWQADTLPVEAVTWYDAVRYCIKRSALEGKENCYDTTITSGANEWKCDATKTGYRLPTSKEWTHAYGGGGTTIYWWGDLSTDAAANAWISTNSGGKTNRVASKTKNGFGLYDMAGNVFEWDGNWFTGYEGYQRAFRGGGWNYGASECTSAGRYKYSPSNAGSHVGFRVVVTAL